MDDTVRYGIVGCAGIGNTHASAVIDAQGAELVACSDLDAEAAGTFAEDHDVPETYTDTATMIEESDLDAVSICTPSGTHAAVTVEAAQAGADILCEKPLDVYTERLDSMIDACEEADVTLAGVFQERFDPTVRGAKRAVDDGDLGDLIFGSTAVKWFRSQPYYDSGAWRGTREMDGGVLLNQAIHKIDTLQWLFGGVESVEAFTDGLAREMECEDTAAIALRFENGALGTIAATTAAVGGHMRIELNGTGGSLILEGSETDFQVATGEESHYHAETEAHTLEEVPHECGTGHDGVVQDFVDALRDGRDPEVPASEARSAVDVILAVYESSETGERVTLGSE